MDKITVRRDGDRFVITDEESGVTTQGESKIEALLMLADALTAYEETDENLLTMARDIFARKTPTEPVPTGVLEGIEDIAEGRTMSADDLDDVLKEPLEAEGNEPIRCPVCGDEIPAFELDTDHAHPRELLKTIQELLYRSR